MLGFHHYNASITRGKNFDDDDMASVHGAYLHK